MRDPDLERPIFVLAGGWRSGSTLLQRLLCSHPEVMVWGESRGLLDGLRASWQAVEALQPLSEKNRANLDRDGHQAWIALANPPFERFRAAMRAFFLTYLAEPAAARGHPRWGFKEVRHGADVAGWLAALFPSARFVFLVRDPEACLASARGTTRKGRGLLPEVGGAEAFVAHWVRTTRSLVDGADRLPATLLRYEDLVDEPEKAIDALARGLDLDPAGFDRAVFTQWFRGWKLPPRLERTDRRLLRRREVRDVAGRLGYTREPTPGPLRRLLARLSGA